MRRFVVILVIAFGCRPEGGPATEPVAERERENPEAGDDPARALPPGIGDNQAGQPCTHDDRCGPDLGCSGLWYDAAGTCIAVSEAQRQCGAQGGEWGQWGMMGAVYCMKLLSDGGKPCKDGDDCVGDCIARDEGDGQCQVHEVQFGCYSTLEDGEVGGAICRD